MSGRRSLSMDYDDQSDSSGTDDDLPPTHSGRASRGVRVSGNGRAATGPIYASSQSTTVDQMIHRLEQEAYTAVLRAFGAQSEVITWAKERLMTDLRKELRVSDEQHREFLGKVAADETLQQIQQLAAVQPGVPNAVPPPAEISRSPAVSQSRKKQKTAHVSQAALPPPPPAPAPALPPPLSKPAPGPSLLGAKRPGQRGKKHKGGRVSTNPKGAGGHRPVGRPASSTKVLDTPSEMSIDPYVGRRVKTRWPEDNTFYEAVITDYNPELGAHALVYDMDTENETWEWINLKEVPAGDLKWVEGPNAVIVGRKAPPPGAKGGMGRGMKRAGGSKAVASPGGRARGAPRGAQIRGWRGPASAENGSRPLELMPLEDLAKEVDKLEEEDDLSKLENAKRAAKAHEEVIRKALAEVGESSDEAESDDAGNPPSSHTQSLEHEREHRSRQNSRDHTADSDEDETAGNDRAEGSDGEHTVGEGGASDAYDDQQGEDGDDKDEDG